MDGTVALPLITIIVILQSLFFIRFIRFFFFPVSETATTFTR
jgi:hypothetical protein